MLGSARSSNGKPHPREPPRRLLRTCSRPSFQPLQHLLASAPLAGQKPVWGPQNQIRHNTAPKHGSSQAHAGFKNASPHLCCPARRQSRAPRNRLFFPAGPQEKPKQGSHLQLPPQVSPACLSGGSHRPQIKARSTLRGQPQSFCHPAGELIALPEALWVPLLARTTVSIVKSHPVAASPPFEMAGPFLHGASLHQRTPSRRKRTTLQSVKTEALQARFVSGAAPSLAARQKCLHRWSCILFGQFHPGKQSLPPDE